MSLIALVPQLPDPLLALHCAARRARALPRALFGPSPASHRGATTTANRPCSQRTHTPLGAPPPLCTARRRHHAATDGNIRVADALLEYAAAGDGGGGCGAASASGGADHLLLTTSYALLTGSSLGLCDASEGEGPVPPPPLMLILARDHRGATPLHYAAQVSRGFL